MRDIAIGTAVAALLLATACGAADASTTRTTTVTTVRVHAVRAWCPPRHGRRVVQRSAHRGGVRVGVAVDAGRALRKDGWDVEMVPGRQVLPPEDAFYMARPGQMGYEDRVPVALGAGGVATPSLALPIRRGFGDAR